MHHVGDKQNDLGKNDQYYRAQDTGNQKVTGAFKNGGQIDFRGQGLDHENVDPHRRCDRPHGSDHRDDDGKPELETKKHESSGQVYTIQPVVTATTRIRFLPSDEPIPGPVDCDELKNAMPSLA